MCNVYGLSYHVAGTTIATSVEANGGFLKEFLHQTPFSVRAERKPSWLFLVAPDLVFQFPGSLAVQLVH